MKLVVKVELELTIAEATADEFEAKQHGARGNESLAVNRYVV